MFFFRRRRKACYGAISVLAIIWLLSHAYYHYSQVTFLSPLSPPLLNSPFPYIYMRAPKVDPRKVFYDTKDIINLQKIIKDILVIKPELKSIAGNDFFWKISRHDHRNLTDLLDKFYAYTNMAISSQSLEKIQHYLDLMKPRKFPTSQRPLSCNRCFKYHFKNIISPKDLCKGQTEVKLISLVTTVPQNSQARMKIRLHTWGSDILKQKYGFKVIFLFGSGWPEDYVNSLTEENEKYNDILMDSFIDNYYNLTQKVLMGFKWVIKECPQVRFVMRSADDTWVNIPKIFKLLSTYGHLDAFQKYQVGSCFPGYIPYRGLDYKGYLNTLEYDQDIFPPYALGTTYITSIRLTKELVELSPNIPYLAIEDAYFGLALAKLGRGCHHIRGMRFMYIKHEPLLY